MKFVPCVMPQGSGHQVLGWLGVFLQSPQLHLNYTWNLNGIASQKYAKQWMVDAIFSHGKP